MFILYIPSAHDKFPIPLHWLYIYDYIIHFLCGSYMPLHCSMLSTHFIKTTTAPPVRCFNWQKIRLHCLFVPLIDNLR